MGIIESLMDSKYELSDFRKKKLLHEFRCFYGEYNHFSGNISSSYVEIYIGDKRNVQFTFHAMTMTKSDNRFVDMEMTYRLLGYLIFRENIATSCRGITLDTPITIKAVPSMRPMAILINIHDSLI